MCVAVPGRIVQILDGPGLPIATVDVAGITRQCCLAYLPEAVVGDYTIIQSGFALTILDEVDALASLSLFEELGVLGRAASGPAGSGGSPVQEHHPGRAAVDEVGGQLS